MEKKGLIGIICTSNHEEILEEWAKDRAITTEVITDAENSLKNSIVTLENLAADVIVIDDDAKGGVNGEFVLRTHISKNPDTKFIFIASAQRHKEDVFIGQLIDEEYYSILLPRYYVDNLGGCKSQFLKFIDEDYSADSIENLLKTYPAKPRKKLFGKKTVEEIPDVLYRDIKGEYDIPEEEKMSEVDYFRGMREEVSANMHRQENSIEADEEDEETDIEDVNKENYQNVVAVTEETETKMDDVQKPHNEANYSVAKNDVEDSDFDAMINKIETGIHKEVEAKVEKDNLESSSPVNIQSEDIQALIHKLVKEEVNSWGLKFASMIKKSGADVGEGQKTYFVTGATPHVGATHFSLGLAFAFAKLEPKSKIAIVLDKKEAQTIKETILSSEDASFPFKYKRVTFYDNKPWEEISELDYDVKIICLPELNTLDFAEFMPLFGQLCVVYGGNAWDSLKLLSPIQKLQANELNDGVIYADFGASSQTVDFVKGLTEKDKNLKFFSVPYDNRILNKNSSVPDGWKEIVFKDKSQKQSNSNESKTDQEGQTKQEKKTATKSTKSRQKPKGKRETNGKVDSEQDLKEDVDKKISESLERSRRMIEEMKESLNIKDEDIEHRLEEMKDELSQKHQKQQYQDVNKLDDMTIDGD